MSNLLTPRLLLLTTAGSGIGGTERMTANLTRQFVTRGWQVRNVYPETPENAALIEWCRAQGIAAERQAAVRAIQFRRTWRDMVALRQFVRASKPNVVNLHYGVGHIALKDILAVRFAGRHRLVVTVHSAGQSDRRDIRRDVMSRVAAALTHKVVAVSSATRDGLMQAGIPAHKVQVIPNGLHVPSSSPPRAEARQRLELPADAFVVGAVARLVPEKGIEDLIRALASIPDPNRTVLLAVAGAGPERARLERLAASCLGERVRFFGAMADPTDLYAAADVFALPSYMEGFGLVYVEAAFHGVPSIGTAVGGVPDVVVDGETGLLVPPRDPAALAAAIAQVRDDPALRTRLGAAARARACREFTEGRMAERYTTVFEA